MKLFVKFLMFLVVLALAGPFILKGPDGRPLMSLQDLKLPSAPLPQTAPEKLTGKEQDAWISWSKDQQKPKEPKIYIIDPNNQQPVQQQAGVFYRWKDDEGVWQFSHTPNPDTPNIVIETDPNANLVQSLSNEKIDSLLGRAMPKMPDGAAADGKDPTESSPTIPLPTTIPITEVPELINQAKAVQDLMNKRNEILDSNQF